MRTGCEEKDVNTFAVYMQFCSINREICSHWKNFSNDALIIIII